MGMFRAVQLNFFIGGLEGGRLGGWKVFFDQSWRKLTKNTFQPPNRRFYLDKLYLDNCLSSRWKVFFAILRQP